MNEKHRLKRKIWEFDFSIKEMELYLDVHPSCRRALALLDELRRKRQELITVYEQRFGPYIVTPNDAPANERWSWIDSPWPWELKDGEV
ncbi:MAG: spore coat protein CotJB [Acutalibacteraceae bacterium]|nr:spore coat protein CotJB [Acutalibacteraceae bacterium]